LIFKVNIEPAIRIFTEVRDHSTVKKENGYSFEGL
jgi:hypothetical protein